MHLLILWEEFLHYCEGHLVEDGKQSSRLLGEPDGQGWDLLTQMRKVDVESLLVALAHLVDTLLIDGGTSAQFLEGVQKLGKAVLDPLEHLWLGQPVSQYALDVFIIKVLLVVFLPNVGTALSELVVDAPLELFTLVILLLHVHYGAGLHLASDSGLPVAGVHLHVRVLAILEGHALAGTVVDASTFIPVEALVNPIIILLVFHKVVSFALVGDVLVFFFKAAVFLSLIDWLVFPIILTLTDC